MWTNVFRIGGLHLISWFQFLPYESDPNSLPEKSLKAEQKDAATLSILSSHLQLQNEGFLSTWTNSFVGPWDPSQGAHNPDEKIKLWLFLPGRHSSIVETAQGAVSRLRVVGSGVWLAPGDSEEVAVALSQALRNCIERSLRRFSYVRFGDVFTRCRPSAASEKNSRRVQPTFEFIFAATEDAIYVHAIISAKHIRGLASDDMEAVSRLRSSGTRKGFPVIVAPNGMRGRLTGCCPSDLVKHVYLSKAKASNGFTFLGAPFSISQSSGCQLRGQSCYVEVTLGCPSTGSDKALQPNSSINRNVSQQRAEEPHSVASGRVEQNQGLSDQFPILERTFIYPAETVLVPIMHRAFARSSPKRFWLHNWAGTSLFDLWPLWKFSGSSPTEQCLGFESSINIDSLDNFWVESNGMHLLHKCNSSNNSNSSSISSTSSTSSDSDYAVAVEARDLEADADSLTCRQSGLSSNDQLEIDGHKMVSKRLRTGVAESFGQTGTVGSANIQDTYKTEYSVVETNNSAAGVRNDQFRSRWDWDDDDRGIGMDILLSEFGDFGDFFEDDFLAFGEPPGTAESQALIFSTADCGDVSGSPCVGGMDVPDQSLLPIVDFSSFESFSQLPLQVTDENCSKNLENTKDARSSVVGSHSSAPLTNKYDYLSKAEAVMTFAPEYAAVETPPSEFSISIFKSPYHPKSKRVESSHSSSSAYVYNATPPSSPCLEVLEDKAEISAKPKLGPRGQDANSSVQSWKYYTLVQNGKKQIDKKLFHFNTDMTSQKGDVPSSISGINLSSATITIKRKKTENMLEAGNFLLSLNTTLATEVECIMFQAAMCRIRHTLLSCSNQVPTVLSRLTGSGNLDQVLSDTCTTPEMMSSRYEVKKKDSVPVRIAGDVDGGMLDRPLTAPVGVWRSVGAPRGSKPANTVCIENSPSFPHNTFNEESVPTNGQRQSLQELLDAMALLVQQSSSFLDVSLDAYGGEGPYYLLALQEQQRRGFSCGPSMVHAGCGGLLAACHSMDIAGVDLVDPFSADVHASSVISLLQSDIKLALKSAFENLDGPLSMIDWCKGRNLSVDAGTTGDGYSVECIVNDVKDSSSSVTLGGDPISPPQSLTGGSSCLRDGARMEESSQRRFNQEICNPESEQQMSSSRFRSPISVLPLPALLVGYQDDWLKTSTNCIGLWEKAPLEPYALPKNMTYYAVCPDIDLLTSAAADFFQQLGTVYETCKLGNHSPQVSGSQTELASGKWPSSGFVLVDCPQPVKITSSNISVVSSVSDYLVALSKGWDMKSYLNSLTKVLRTLKLGSNSTINQKEGSSGPCMVIYVVCPFPEPSAVLQTVIASSTAIGSVILASEKERRALLHSQVTRALSCAAAADEASISNVLMLSGFSISKLVLQIVTVDSLLRVSKPGHELAILKEFAFAVYNKARRIPRASSAFDIVQSSAVPGRSQSTMMHVSSHIPGLWKDCLAPRISGPTLTREGELDATLRPGTWDNSWQTSRTTGLNCESNRSLEFLPQDDVRYLFEPLFILAEPGCVEHGNSIIFGSAASESSNSRSVVDDSSGGYMQSSTSAGGAEVGTNSLLDGSEHEQKTPSLHCCYGWTEDWRWLVCIWTDSRGELLDSQVFPFGGISSRQDTKVLQCLFVQILHQGCQILSCSSHDFCTIRPRDIIITRIGCFFELECQEWQKAIYSVGGNEVKRWPLQLRHSVPDGVPSSNNGTSLQQQEMGLIQERTLPSSPSPSLYSPHAKSSGYMKGSLGQNNAKKQLSVGQTSVDSSRGLFQLVQSISLIGVSVDHSLHLMLPADTCSSGGATQTSGYSSLSGYLESFSPVKSLGSMSASYLLIPSPSMRYLPPTPLQLPTSLTSESPPLAHLLHSKGSAIPLATGYIVSKTVPAIRKDPHGITKEEWPSVLSVSLVDHYGGNNSNIQEKIARASSSSHSGVKHARALGFEASSKDYELECHLVLESVAAELHSLSWMTASPVYLERRSALPFHCDMLLRLRRLLHYADKELSRPPEKA